MALWPQCIMCMQIWSYRLCLGVCASLVDNTQGRRARNKIFVQACFANTSEIPCRQFYLQLL